MPRRADIVVHAPDGAPLAVVECKAPSVPIRQDTFDQAARYNLVFKVPVLLVTNGRTHYACHIERSTGTVRFLGELPDHGAMIALRHH